MCSDKKMDTRGPGKGTTGGKFGKYHCKLLLQCDSWERIKAHGPLVSSPMPISLSSVCRKLVIFWTSPLKVLGQCKLGMHDP